MPPKNFKTAMETFLTPVVKILNTRKPTCEINWFDPNEPAENKIFSLPLAEIQHYLASMISEGFCVAIRFSSTPGGDHLRIDLWEEWDGGFNGTYWPLSDDQPEFEAVWSGFPANEK